jgi:hypothetical protein
MKQFRLSYTPKQKNQQKNDMPKSQPNDNGVEELMRLIAAIDEMGRNPFPVRNW